MSRSLRITMVAVFLPLLLLAVLLLIAEDRIGRNPARGLFAANHLLALLAAIAIILIAFLLACHALNRRLQPLHDLLRARELEFERRTTALNESPDALLRLGLDGRIHSLNPSASRMLGIEIRRDNNGFLAACLSNDSRRLLLQQLANAMEIGIGSCRLEIRRQDGTFMPVTAAFAPLSLQEGNREDTVEVAVCLMDLSALPRPQALDQSSKIAKQAATGKQTEETISSRPVQAPANHGQSAESLGNVLLIEDHEISRMIASKMLKSFQCIVYEAENANQAYELLKAIGSRIDLVLMDLHMPGIDGIEAVRTIRSMEEFSSLPIVIQTADSSLDQHMRCLAAGANEVMTKPIELKQLRQLLERWIGSVPIEPRISLASERRISESPEWKLEGLNAVEALERVDGRIPFYLAMLNRFQDRYRDLLPCLQRSLEGGEHAEVIRILHTFRGAASHLSANGVYEAATRLEQSLKLGASDGPKLLEEFGRQLNIVFQSIDKYKKSISLANISDTGGDLL